MADRLSNPKQKKVIIVSGPTAVGKTSVAIQLAKFYNTEIISADSRQCFKELTIGVAKPSPEELLQVTHHFISTHSVLEEVSAVSFEQYALEKVAALFKEHDIVIMVGGTGLYIKAFCEGLDTIPGIDPAIRQQVIQSYEEKGITWLQQQLQEKDPLFRQAGEMKNPQRMMRALEVLESTGHSIVSFHNPGKAPRDFKSIKVGLELTKEELHRNIESRVDIMMEAGLLDEVKQLFTLRNLNALQTVGYRELFDYIDGNISLEKAIGQIKSHTRQYAKRQMTWFKKDKEIAWFNPRQVHEMIEWVQFNAS